MVREGVLRPKATDLRQARDAPARCQRCRGTLVAIREDGPNEGVCLNCGWRWYGADVVQLAQAQAEMQPRRSARGYAGYHARRGH